MSLAAAGAVISALSSIGGAIGSAIKNKKARAGIQDEKEKNKSWYERQMASDYVGRSDAQALLSEQRKMINEKYRQARATNAVAGGSEESVAAQKEAANKAAADSTAAIAANASARKDAVEQQYRETDSKLSQAQAAAEAQQAQQIAAAAGQAVNAGVTLIGATQAPAAPGETPDTPADDSTEKKPR